MPLCRPKALVQKLRIDMGNYASVDPNILLLGANGHKSSGTQRPSRLGPQRAPGGHQGDGSSELRPNNADVSLSIVDLLVHRADISPALTPRTAAQAPPVGAQGPRSIAPSWRFTAQGRRLAACRRRLSVQGVCQGLYLAANATHLPLKPTALLHKADALLHASNAFPHSALQTIHQCFAA